MNVKWFRKDFDDYRYRVSFKQIVGLLLLFVSLIMCILSFWVSAYTTFCPKETFESGAFFIWVGASVVFLCFTIFLYIQLEE